MARKTRTSKLTNMIVDDLNQKELTLSVDALVPFSEHPFRAYSEEKMQDMVQSIQENGLLSPIIVRPKGDKYEIIAGHNRWQGAKLAGLKQVDVIIKDVDDDTATLLMIDTNFNQRDVILPSEKAFAYKMRMDALKHQGKRLDDTSCHSGTNSDDDTLCHSGTKTSAEQIAQENQDSARQVYRYIQLTNLIPPLLDKVDKGELGFISGVDISYLTQAEQTLLHEYLAQYPVNISKVHSDQLKKMSAEKNQNSETLTFLDISNILQPKTSTNTMAGWKISGKQLQKKLPKDIASQMTPERADAILEEALALWVEKYSQT